MAGAVLRVMVTGSTVLYCTVLHVRTGALGSSDVQRRITDLPSSRRRCCCCCCWRTLEAARGKINRPFFVVFCSMFCILKRALLNQLVSTYQEDQPVATPIIVISYGSFHHCNHLWLIPSL